MNTIETRINKLLTIKNTIENTEQFQDLTDDEVKSLSVELLKLEILERVGDRIVHSLNDIN